MSRGPLEEATQGATGQSTHGGSGALRGPQRGCSARTPSCPDAEGEATDEPDGEALPEALPALPAAERPYLEPLVVLYVEFDFFQ